eukprot:scaffold7389_cov778-Prasinococcus_capsulatus_cf.AAC.2
MPFRHSPLSRAQPSRDCHRYLGLRPSFPGSPAEQASAWPSCRSAHVEPSAKSCHSNVSNTRTVHCVYWYKPCINRRLGEKPSGSRPAAEQQGQCNR